MFLDAFYFLNVAIRSMGMGSFWFTATFNSQYVVCFLSRYIFSFEDECFFYEIPCCITKRSSAI